MWHPARGGRDAGEVEASQRLVVAGHLALALQDVHLHLRLGIGGCGEYLRAAGGDGGVALDHPGEHAAQGLDAQGERGDVEEQDVLDLALEHPGLEGGAGGDHLVGVDPLVGVLAGEAVHQLLDGGHAGGAADQDDVVDVGHLDAGVLDGLLERAPGLLH